MRLTDESAVLRDAFPPEYADVAVFITDLGGASFLMFALALLFWLSRRRESALVVSYAFAGLAFILTVKALLGMPRPPEEVFLIPVDGDEYGFPSGHTFAAVIVYGGLYSVFDLARERIALVAVSVLVVLIALTRVVLGMHYLGDVIAGGILGVGFVLAMNRLTDGDPRRGFAIAIAVSIGALVATGGVHDSLFGLGGAIGGLLGSLRLESVPPLRSRLEGAVLAIAGVAFIVGVTTLESAVADVFVPALVPLSVVLILGIFLVPTAIGRLDVPALERGLRS